MISHWKNVPPQPDSMCAVQRQHNAALHDATCWTITAARGPSPVQRLAVRGSTLLISSMLTHLTISNGIFVLKWGTNSNSPFLAAHCYLLFMRHRF